MCTCSESSPLQPGYAKGKLWILCEAGQAEGFLREASGLCVQYNCDKSKHVAVIEMSAYEAATRERDEATRSMEFYREAYLIENNERETLDAEHGEGRCVPELKYQQDKIHSYAAGVRAALASEARHE